MKSIKRILALSICAATLFACACGGGNTDSSSSFEEFPGGEIPKEEPLLKEEQGYFVQDGNTQYTIVMPTEATDTENYAAEELRRYIQMVGQCTIDVQTDEGKTYSAADKVISIGKTVYQKGADLSDVDYKDLKTGGFIIRNYDDLYILDSGCNEGVLYAAYEFLSIFFGVEFLTYHDTYMPEQEEVKSYDVNLVSIPDFPIRDYYAYHVWYHGEAYGAKLKMNSTSFKASSNVSGDYSYKYYGYYYTDENGNEQFGAREGHTIETLLCIDAYREGYNPTANYKTWDNGGNGNLRIGYYFQHPEWYGYDPNNGRSNSYGKSQEEVCYMNGYTDDGELIIQPDDVAFEDMTLPTKMIQIIKNMILEEKSEQAVYLMLGHADFTPQCWCERCVKAYETFGSFGGVTVMWANGIIEQVRQWMEAENIDREVKYVIFGYAKSLTAPVKWNKDGTCVPVNDKVVCDKDMVIKMAYRNCVYHSLWDESCEQNQVLRDSFTGWTTVADSIAIWDYTSNFEAYPWYLPNFGTIQDNYRYYQTINVEHLLSQGTPGEYNFYEHSLHMWVSCELMWETDQDVNDLIKEFNRLYFGEKYATYVNAYRDLFENYFAVLDATKETGFHAATYNDLDFMNAETYDADMLLRAANIIQEAIDEVNKESELNKDEKETLVNKLRSVKITPQYMLLYMNMIQDEVLKMDVARDFFESIDILKLTYWKEGNLAANSYEEMKKAYGL